MNGPQIAIPRQMIWINAINNMLHSGECPDLAIPGADQILAAYEERFPSPDVIAERARQIMLNPEGEKQAP